MNELISSVANTKNIDAIKKIESMLNRYGRVFVVGKQANPKSKLLAGENVFISDDCDIVCCCISS